jgi:hypothetical protein
VSPSSMCIDMSLCLTATGTLLEPIIEGASHSVTVRYLDWIYFVDSQDLYALLAVNRTLALLLQVLKLSVSVQKAKLHASKRKNKATDVFNLKWAAYKRCVAANIFPGLLSCQCNFNFCACTSFTLDIFQLDVGGGQQRWVEYHLSKE